MVQKIVTSENTNEGYDALRDCYVDMIEEGEIGERERERKGVGAAVSSRE